MPKNSKKIPWYQGVSIVTGMICAVAVFSVFLIVVFFPCEHFQYKFQTYGVSLTSEWEDDAAAEFGELSVQGWELDQYNVLPTDSDSVIYILAVWKKKFYN